MCHVQGQPDQRMKHLGCPVVQGDKWIVNKWVKWHHHMFSYPCTRCWTEHGTSSTCNQTFYSV